MRRVDIRELAEAMVRHHGRSKGHALAIQYAADAAALEDHPTRIRWSRVAQMLGESLALEQRATSR